MSEEEMNEEAVKFTLGELRHLRDQIDQRVKQLESILQDSQTAARAPPAKIVAGVQSSVATDATASEVVNRLEELP